MSFLLCMMTSNIHQVHRLTNAKRYDYKELKTIKRTSKTSVKKCESISKKLCATKYSLTTEKAKIFPVQYLCICTVQNLHPLQPPPIPPVPVKLSTADQRPIVTISSAMIHPLLPSICFPVTQSYMNFTPCRPTTTPPHTHNLHLVVLWESTHSTDKWTTYTTSYDTVLHDITQTMKLQATSSINTNSSLTHNIWHYFPTGLWSVISEAVKTVWLTNYSQPFRKKLDHINVFFFENWKKNNSVSVQKQSPL